ncbi:MAG: (Fe-S)-binding protein [Desulfobacterales bacterium]
MTGKKAVTLFVPCLVDAFRPEAAEAVVAVFERLGVAVGYPEGQTCCGQPAFNAGYRDEARRAARRFLRLFAAAEAVVCPSGSCVAMVRHHYPALFEEEPDWRELARRTAARTFEFTEYLVDVLGAEDLGASFAGRVTYHDSCHLLRGLGVRLQPRRLLRRVKGLEFVEMKNADCCCGFGGAFSVKYPDISTALVADKIAWIQESGAEAVVGGDLGCLLNIEGALRRRGLPIRALHIAQVLAGERFSREGARP